MMIILENNRLKLEVEEPGEIYRRSRFNWIGIIRQITLDRTVPFCSMEASPGKPGTEGTGFHCEFGLHTPVGYEETAVGDLFPKIGIGFLKKDKNEPYDFFRDYEIEPAVNEFATEKDSVTFLQNAGVVNGWGWRLKRTIAIRDNVLELKTELFNTGEKTIRTEEYNHNFLRIGNADIGPDYALAVPFIEPFENELGPVGKEGKKITVKEIPEEYFYASKALSGKMEKGEWSLVHKSGHGISCREEFPFRLFAVWGMKHVISPEFFIDINLPPGQSETWKRIYMFK